eukprot:ANDGO_04415.mRNA.1 Glycolipid 2-alpha-mannosyltransferase
MNTYLPRQTPGQPRLKKRGPTHHAVIALAFVFLSAVFVAVYLAYYRLTAFRWVPKMQLEWMLRRAANFDTPRLVEESPVEAQMFQLTIQELQHNKKSLVYKHFGMAPRRASASEDPSSANASASEDPSSANASAAATATAGAEVLHPNACVVFLIQRVHSSFHRESLSNLSKSLHLLFENWPDVRNYDVLLFHGGEFDSWTAAQELNAALGRAISAFVKVVRVPHRYWGVPTDTVGKEVYMQDWDHQWQSEGYRHMTRWFAYNMMEYLHEVGYDYVIRLDDDSFVRTPIVDDPFVQMQMNQWVYGYHMLLLEPVYLMLPEVVAHYIQQHSVNPTMLFDYVSPERNVKSLLLPRQGWNLQNLSNSWPCVGPSCGTGWSGVAYYTNFFVADIGFWMRPEVREFWLYLDRSGGMYLRRWGDVMVHTMIVQIFAKPSEVHQFDDFVYEHVTRKDGKCNYGGMRGSWNVKDRARMETLLNEFLEQNAPEAVRVGDGAYCDPIFFFQDRCSPHLGRNHTGCLQKNPQTVE